MYDFHERKEPFQNLGVKEPKKQTNTTMKTKSIMSYAFIVMITIAGLSSCKKENLQPSLSKNQLSATSVQMLAENKASMNHLVYKTILIAFGASTGDINAFKNENSDQLLGNCATITKDTTVMPYTIRIDFDNNCTLNDGSPVTGFITATWTNNNFGIVAGSQAVLNYDSFYINGNHILGIITIQNKGTNANGNTDFDINMTNGSMIYGSDGSLVKQDVQWLLEWIKNGTSNKDDDFFSFTGTASGVTSNGDNYTETIINPLLISRDPNCVHMFVSGVTLAVIDNNPDLQIDYGPGTCDDRADATQGGVTVRITLKNY